MSRPRIPFASPEAALAAYQSTRSARAVTAFFDLTAPALLRAAMLATRDASLADDVVQETYAVFLDDLDAYDQSRPVMPWLRGILRHRAMRARSQARRTPDPNRLLPRESNTGLPPAAIDEIRCAIDALDEPYRSTSLLHFIYGLDPKEIADVCSEPAGTIRSRIHRAREQLQAKLKRAPALTLLDAPTRALDALRASVLTRVDVATGVARSTAMIGGAVVGGEMMSKKIVVVCAVLALLLAGSGIWLLVRDRNDQVVGNQQNDTLLSSAPTLKSSNQENVKDAAALSPSIDPSLRISGTVRDANGASIGGAKITLAPIASYRLKFSSKQGFPIEAGATDGGVDTRSAENGEFELHPPSSGVYAVNVEAAGYSPQGGETVQAGGRINVMLWPGATLHVQAKNKAGKPVSGATISIQGVVGRNIYQQHGTTNGDGIAVMEGLPTQYATGGVLVSAPHFYLRANAKGYAPFVKLAPFPTNAGESKKTSIVLERGLLIHGHVVSGLSEKPLPGANVRLANAAAQAPSIVVDGEELWWPFALYERETQVADDAGRFSMRVSSQANRMALRSMPAVYAWAQGTALGRSLVSEAVLDNDRAGHATLVVTVPASASVRGRVVDTQGRPVADCRVSVNVEEPRSIRAPRFPMVNPAAIDPTMPQIRARTDASGEFEFRGIAVANEGETLASVRGFKMNGAHRSQGYRQFTKELALNAGGVHDTGTMTLVEAPRDPKLPPVILRDVYVKNERDEPVPAARVCLCRVLSRHGSITDERGQVTIEQPKSTHPRTYSVRARGYGTTQVTVESSHDGPLTVVMQDARRLTGRLVDQEGKPVPGWRIEAVSATRPLEQAYPSRVPIQSIASYAVSVSLTDYDGRFTLQDLGDDRVHLRASRRDMTFSAAPKPVIRKDVDVSEPVLIRIGAGLLNSADVVTRVIEQESSSSLENVRATLGGVDGVLSADGTLTFRGVPHGVQALTIDAPGRVRVTKRWTIDASFQAPSTIEMKRGITLSGAVSFPESAGIASQYTIMLRSLDGHEEHKPPYAYIAINQGRYKTEGLEAGRYRVLAMDRTGGMKLDSPCFVAQRELNLEPNVYDVQQDFTFVGCGRLHLKMNDDARLPPVPWPGSKGPSSKPTEAQSAFGKASSVSILDNQGRVLETRTGLTQRFVPNVHYLWLTPGRYTVRGSFPNLPDVDHEVEITSGGTSTIVVRPPLASESTR